MIFYLNEVREEHAGQRKEETERPQRAQCLKGIRNGTCFVSDQESS